MNILKHFFCSSMLFIPCIASAGEVGHYAAGGFSPRELLSPERGKAEFAAGYSGYITKDIRDQNGHDATKGLVDVDINIWQAFLIIGYSTQKDVLGANYSFYISPTYGETSISAYLSNFDAIGFDKGRTKLGDTTVIPLNLTWELSDYYNISAQYSFWAPTGSYHKDHMINTGLGYWSHDFRLTGSYFPLGNPATLLSASTLYEFNMKKKGFDITPGDRLVFELGASQVLSEYLLIGALGTANYEITQTTGKDSTDNGKDRVYSYGLEAIVPIDSLSFTFRYLKEFGARDTSQGDYLYIYANYEF